MLVHKWDMKKGMSTDEAVKVVLQSSIHRTLKATHIPRNVSKNTVFVVDTSKLSDVADVKCDDLGAWHCMGSAKFYYSNDQKGKSYKYDIDDPDDCPAGHLLYIVQCQYFRNKSLPSLHRKVADKCTTGCINLASRLGHCSVHFW